MRKVRLNVVALHSVRQQCSRQAWCRARFVEFSLEHFILTTTGSIMAKYSYSSLRDKDIRLLRILPNADENSRIECLLSTHSVLNSGSSHHFEALSYVWGSENSKCPIYLDGHEFTVKANLYAALSHLRDQFVDRVVWVDAICINQDDKNERGRQVQSMAKINAKTSRVVVWLGESEGQLASFKRWKKYGWLHSNSRKMPQLAKLTTRQSLDCFSVHGSSVYG